MSFVGNRGTFTRGYKAMITDVEFLYHLLYLIICSLGVFYHVFFYSLLVCEHTQNIKSEPYMAQTVTQQQKMRQKWDLGAIWLVI